MCRVPFAAGQVTSVRQLALMAGGDTYQLYLGGGHVLNDPPRQGIEGCLTDPQ